MIKYIYGIENIDWSQLFALYEKVGLLRRFIKDKDYETIKSGFMNSFKVVTAWDGDKLVGAGRMISDGRCYGMIFDLGILPEYQKKGIGKSIVLSLLKDCENITIHLTSTLGNEGFFNNLETDRLLLKNIDMEDKEFIFSEFSDPVINKYLFDEEAMEDISEAEELIKFYTVPEPRLQHRWVIIRKADNRRMGTCGFHRWDTEKGRVEVGYELKEEFWNNGYMQEAVKEIIKFAKENMDVKEIYACVFIDNKSSSHLVEKLGFNVSGSYNEVFKGKEYPHNIYSLYL